MLAPTHIAFSVVTVLGTAVLRNRPCSLLGLAVAALGSLLPDIDTAKSIVGRLVYWLSSPWEKKIGHRTLAHSLLGIAGFALLTSPLSLVHLEAYFLLLVGYTSHIALDTTSKRGCDLFYPSRLRAVLPGSASWRFEVGGKGEMILLVGLLIAAAVLYPAAQLGLEGVLDRLSGDFDRALREFAAAEHAQEHWIVGTMKETLTERPRHGRYRVVGKDGPRLLLLIDDTLIALGKADAAQLYPLKVHLERGQPYSIEVHTVDLSGQTLGALHATLRANDEHWLFGTVTLAEPLKLLEPVGRYAPLHASGSTLRLHYARWADVLPHAQAEVRGGSVVIKRHLPQGTASADQTVAAPDTPRQTITVTLTLKSLESLQVKVGAVVQRGDPLAYDPEVDDKIADLQHQLTVLRTPPVLAPPETTPHLHITGDPDALLAEGVIDRKEHREITTARAHKLAREQQLDLQRRSHETRLAALHEQRVIRAKISGEVSSIQVVSVKQENVTVELKIATTASPLDAPSVPPPMAARASAPAAAGGNTQIDSFEAAKKVAPQIYADRQQEFYCGCRYSGKEVDLASCGYQPKRDAARAQRLEWEHVVPAAAFGQAFAEWRDGHPECVDSKGKAFKGRNCAKRMAPAFRVMEGDLHNLQPAIGEVNGLRSNYSYAMIEGEKREFGACDVEIEDRKAEPRPEIRGDIARIYFYMDAAYPGRGIMSASHRALFAAWDREDPVDAWECERDRRIARLQGNANPFVQAHCAR